MSVMEEYERAPKRLKVSAEDEEELEEGEESDSASPGLMGEDEEDEGQRRARWSSSDRKVRPESLYLMACALIFSMHSDSQCCIDMTHV